MKLLLANPQLTNCGGKNSRQPSVQGQRAAVLIMIGSRHSAAIYVASEPLGPCVSLAPLAHCSRDPERRWCVFTTHRSVTEVMHPSVPEQYRRIC